MYNFFTQVKCTTQNRKILIMIFVGEGFIKKMFRIKTQYRFVYSEIINYYTTFLYDIFYITFPFL